MANCIVIGRIVCGDKPLPGVKVKIDLLEKPKVPLACKPNSVTVVTDKNGWYGEVFDIPTKEVATALGGWAFASFQCPGGNATVRKLKIQQSKLTSSKKTLEVILKTVSEALLKKLLKVKTVPIKLTPDFVGLVAFDKSFDCCKK